MRIVQDNSHDADYIGEIQENRVGIDRNNIDFITTLLTSNLYSHPLESFLRESVSNAYDSHVEAGTNEYILLLINKIAYNSFKISIRDYGVGLSPERFDQIYRNIGSSTKRDSNDYIGGFGIGRLSGLSCSDVVDINSFYNGIKYSYLMYKNGSGINIDKISEISNDSFKNGLEVTVTVNASDRDLETAIRSLVLFEKLHIEYKDTHNSFSYSNESLKNLINEFNSRIISHYKTFSISNVIPRYKQYVKVGNVLYQTDRLDDLQTDCGIMVDVPIGELDITPSREALQYTDRTLKSLRYHVSEVKKELQEIVDKIQTDNFTLKQFYNFVTSSSIQYEKDSQVLSINRKDISLLEGRYVIQGCQTPDDFASFIEYARHYTIDPSNIYKIFNKTRERIDYRRITKTSIVFSSILNESVYLGHKKDKVTKSVTSKWFEYNTDGCIVMLYDIDSVKEDLRKYLKDTSATNIDACIEFLFKILNIKEMSNDSIPKEYLTQHKTSKKKKIELSNNTIPIRVYSSSSYYASTLEEHKSDGLIIYSVNTKEDSNIRMLASLLSPICNVIVITCKKEHLSVLENDSRYISFDDFIDIPNGVLRKLVTAIIILRNFDSPALKEVKRSVLGYKFSYLPIYQEFLRKYGKYYDAAIGAAIESSFVENLIDTYELNGWYNKTDVEYFKISPDEAEALSIMQNMEVNKTEIVKCLAFFMFGKNYKIGLNKPKISICKYLKRLKYECV